MAVVYAKHVQQALDQQQQRQTQRIFGVSKID